MPTLEGHFDDLLGLLHQKVTPQEMDRTLDRVKGEWKSYDPGSRRFKVELNDTNRPDLWSVEGIARQLRGGSALHQKPYDFLEKASARDRKGGAPDIRIDPSVASVRPFLGGFCARGSHLGDEGLTQLIGTQERLSELFGRKRADVAIGVYPLARLAFPLTYRTADPEGTRFIPLGAEESLTLRDIVSTHPKGQAYGDLVTPHAFWPILVDGRGEVLSFPPVINARALGEVTPQDEELFVEATGFDAARLLLVLNILAANLADRGFVIEPLLSEGDNFRMVAPAFPEITVFVPEGLPSRVLGSERDPADFVETLSSFGYPQFLRREENGEAGWEVLSPFYRDDLLGAVDVVEDYLVAKGYDTFEPALPKDFTRGRPSPRQKAEFRLRTALLAMGFQELLSNILTGEPLVTERLGRERNDLVRIDNPASLQFAVVRPTLLSGLLASEARSSRFPYPHKIFEIGEAMRLGPSLSGGERPVQDLWLLSGMLSHPQASVSELLGILEMVLERMDRTLSLRSADLPPYLPGRCGVYENGKGETVGTVGEVHPATLDLWGIRMPTVCFEVDLEGLLLS